MSYSPIVSERVKKAVNAKDSSIGSLDKDSPNVGTGLVGAPACGDVMKLQLEIDDNMVIKDAKYKTFGCGSAIASSSFLCGTIVGKSIDELKISNTDIARELSLPPVKLHCSTLAEEALNAAIGDWKAKNNIDK